MLTVTPHIDLAAKLTGRVVTAADPDWDAIRQVYNLTTDARPEAIALPADAADVATAVRYAADNRVRIAPQATGHNLAAHGSLEDVLLLDVRELKEISIDPVARRVRVGAGVRWHEVVPQLSEMGLAALHGSSPLVGIAGYSLGGGMGWLARKHGLQTNSVTALEVVTADGHARRIDADNEPELFWALRGGNGNYGVVTAIEFEVFPARELYAGAMFFGFERAPELLHTWAELNPQLPDEMMTWAVLLQFPDMPEIPEPFRGGSFGVLQGAYLGDEAQGRDLLRPLRSLGPDMDTFAMVPPVELSELAMDPPEPVPFASTTALLSDLPAAGVDDVVAAVGPGSGSPLPLVQLRQMGGAMATAPEGAGARATLPGSVSMFALGVAADEESAAVTRTYLDSLQRAVTPYNDGAYPNFVEAHAADARAFFDEETWVRLREAKSAYDPDEMFKGNHYIPPAA